MGESTGISWCDATVNFWHGCKKVSEGCKFCYMYRDKDRWKKDGNVVVQSKGSTIAKTLLALRIQARQRKQDGNMEPLKVFTCSWSDFFIDEADSWREQAWEAIRSYPEFIWIILTKRPERIMQCLPADWGDGWNNVWLLVSAENQERFDERVPILANVPAKIRGVSAEPLLGKIDITKNYPCGKGEVPYGLLMDWIILGGESGNDTGKWLYRPAQVHWFAEMIFDCVEHEIPVFMKQTGTAIAKTLKLKDRSGATISEYPWVLQDLKVQQFPKSQRPAPEEEYNDESNQHLPQ